MEQDPFIRNNNQDYNELLKGRNKRRKRKQFVFENEIDQNYLKKKFHRREKKQEIISEKPSTVDFEKVIRITSDNEEEDKKDINYFISNGLFKEKMNDLKYCKVPTMSKEDKILKLKYLNTKIGSENYNELTIDNFKKTLQSSNLQQLQDEDDIMSHVTLSSSNCQKKLLIHKKEDDEYLFMCQQGEVPYFTMTRDLRGDGTGKEMSAFKKISNEKLLNLEMNELKSSKIKLNEKDKKQNEILLFKCGKFREIFTRIAHNTTLQKLANERYEHRVEQLYNEALTTDKEGGISKSLLNQEHTENKYVHPLNIVHIVLDGISRINFMKEMEQTVNALESIEIESKKENLEYFKVVNRRKENTHRVFQFFRFNTIGHSARENFIATEVGSKIGKDFYKTYFNQHDYYLKKEEEDKKKKKNEENRQYELLTKIFKLGKDHAHENKERNWIDQSIWNIAKKLGYVTSFSTTECPYIQTLNSRNGLKRNYFDNSNYLFNTWHRADHNLISLACDKEIVTNYHHHYNNERKCIGGKDLHDLIFEYNKDFMYKYGSTARYSMIHFEESKHIRRKSLIKSLDNSLSNFIKEIIKEHPHTLIILNSVNGISNGPFYTTQIGQLEHSLPLLMLIVPEHLRTRYNDQLFTTLSYNQQLLVTPFDLYTTLIHFMLFPQLELPNRYKKISEIHLESNNKNDNKRGEDEMMMNNIEENELVSKSLLEPIPLDRTCESAGIDGKWCICSKREDLTQQLIQNDDDEDDSSNDDSYDGNSKLKNSRLTNEKELIQSLVKTIVQQTITYLNQVTQKHRSVCQSIDSRTKLLRVTKFTKQFPSIAFDGREIPYILSVQFLTSTNDVFEVDYSLFGDNKTLGERVGLRRVSFIEQHDETVQQLENVMCDKSRGLEHPDYCICRMK
ncbi:hypothetical protein ABK040_009108 [Willaertia magna]